VSRWRLRAVTNWPDVWFWKEKKQRICSSIPFAAQKQNFSAGWIHGNEIPFLFFICRTLVKTKASTRY
jgi:hypothetical protein